MADKLLLIPNPEQLAKRQEDLLQCEELLDRIEDCDPLAMDVGYVLEDKGILDLAAKLPRIKWGKIADKILTHFVNAHKGDRFDYKKEIESRVSSPSKKSRSDVATRDDYYELYESVLGEMKVDIFSGSLVCQEGNLWTAADNQLRKLRSEAGAKEDAGAKRFFRGHIDDHLATYAESRGLAPELCVKIDDWDGTDRIKQMCRCLKIAPNDSGVDEFTVYDLTCRFMALMFKRLENPKVQNPVLALQGPGGIGKDFWLGTLVDGLGQYAREMSVGGSEKDMYLQLSRGLVNKIPEFDKLATREEHFLKDIIFKSDTDIRKAYDREESFRLIRCSFVASFNPQIGTVLRDQALCRRFVIFPVQSIDWGYEIGSRAQEQILAQGRHLCREGYRAAPESLDVMKRFLEQERAPMNAELVRSYWFSLLNSYLESVGEYKASEMRSRNKLRLSEVKEVVKEVVIFTGLKGHRLNQEMRAAGIKDEDKHGIYFLAVPKSPFHHPVSTKITTHNN